MTHINPRLTAAELNALKPYLKDAAERAAADKNAEALVEASLAATFDADTLVRLYRECAELLSSMGASETPPTTEMIARLERLCTDRYVAERAFFAHARLHARKPAPHLDWSAPGSAGMETGT